MINMRKFNLEEAKAGKPVVTRGGEAVEIIKFNLKDDQPIVAVITDEHGEEDIQRYNENGNYYTHNDSSGYDLFMATPVIKLEVHTYRRITGEYLARTTLFNDPGYVYIGVQTVEVPIPDICGEE